MEIRNITPMTRNNTSFGMALKIKPEDVEEFTKYITSSKYKKNIVDSGLKQFVKEQAKNKFANILYIVDDNSFTVVPKEGAVSSYGSRNFAVKESKGTSLDRVLEAADKEAAAVVDKSKFIQFATYAKNAAKSLKAVFDLKYRNPQELLPANLQAAGKYANKIQRESERIAKINDILNQG